MGRQIIFLAIGFLAPAVHATRSVHRLVNATRSGPSPHELSANAGHVQSEVVNLRGVQSREGHLAAAVSATVEAATVKEVEKSRHRVPAALGRDPYLCLNARFNAEPCLADQCADAERKCHASSGRRTGIRFRISPQTTIGAFLRAEIFPQKNGQEEPALRLVDGWKWERDDANWIVVASPDAKSVLLSTAASWPADQTRLEGPVRVLDFDGSSTAPRMMPLQAGGQAEWTIEQVKDDHVRLKHHRTGRYLHMPGISGFFQALLQLWSGEPHLDSSKVPNTNTLFVLTPPEAVEELKTLGLVQSSEEDPYNAFTLRFEIPHVNAIKQRIEYAFTDARQYMHIHKGLVLGGFFILFALSCFTWCCCLGPPLEDEKASRHQAPAPMRSQNYVRRAPRRNV